MYLTCFSHTKCLLFCNLFLNYLLFVSSNIVYTPSDAYEESLLRPFRSYSDVAIFHFSVPFETKRAVWQFVAFMDDPSCSARNVHIYLRHGSYPVVSPDNSSFPSEVIVPFKELFSLRTLTNYQPKEMPEFHMINPLPGSWFGIAYIQDWNHEIKVPGMGHKCHYSLGSMAAWTVQPNIRLITPGANLQVVATSQVNYFKFFVPDSSWSFRLLITNCSTNITENQDNRGVSNNAAPCVRQFGLRALALPNPELTNHSMGPFLKSVQQPQSNLYYYIVIVSDHRSSFDLTAELVACSSNWRQNISPGTSRSSSSHILKSGYVKEEWFTLTGKVRKNRTKRFQEEESGGEGLSEDLVQLKDDCLPVITLTRVKHAQDFLDSFLLQGRDWFSSWLAVSEAFPILVKFDLLPFVDIGGTLQTKINLDAIVQNLTSQIIRVSMCVNPNSSPVFLDGKALCQTEHSFWVSSNESLSAVKYFPFPKPGTWFISFQVECFNYSGALETETCELEQVMLDLAIRLQPCLFEGQPCGSRGLCRENHFRQFYFSSCQCTSGWRGWGCTDGEAAVSTSVQLIKTLLLTLSNVFFVPAVVLALKRQFYTEAVVYAVTMFFSIFYHACDVDTFGFCLMKYNVLQFCDFYSAILSVWVTVLAMAGLSDRVLSVAHMVGALGISLGVEYQRTGLWVFVAPLLIGVFIMFFSWGCRCYQVKSCLSFQSRQLVKLVGGSFSALSGLALFAFVETEENYKYVHSIWHIIVALSIAFLLPLTRQRTEPTEPISIVEQAVFFTGPLTNDAEMLDIGEYRINSSDLQALVGQTG